jgi:uncharacterized protein YbjT (DUF2867 family)
VDSAYYLVHSKSVGADFAEVDRLAAANFGRAAARAGVRRIIHLGGLANQAGSLSSHLQSRAETGSVLRASGVPVIEFRASIVVGAGSLSFQMNEALVERLPIMVCPTTAGSRSSARRRPSILEACWAAPTGTSSCPCTDGCSADS